MQDYHFRETIVDTREYSTIQNVGNEQTGWATRREAIADSDEQGRSDGASNGDQLNMSVFESSLKTFPTIDLAVLDIRLGQLWVLLHLQVKIRFHRVCTLVVALGRGRSKEYKLTTQQSVAYQR